MNRSNGDTEYQAVIGEYRTRAADYDGQWAEYVNATVARTLSQLSPIGRAHVLDVGCGTGVLLHSLARREPEARLTGIDPVSEMLAVARARLPASVGLVRGRAEQLPIADEGVDVVLSSSVFHYLERPASALAEMYRTLRPAGRLVVTDWCREFVSMRLCGMYLRLTGQPFHRIYRTDELYELLDQAGFEAIRIERYKIDRLWGMMTAEATK